MANVTGMCSNMPGPNEQSLEVISLNVIKHLNGCRQCSEMTLLRTQRLVYILEWTRLKAILQQVCSLSFTAFINVCLHFCYRCSGMWNCNGVWSPKELTIGYKIQCDILTLWCKVKPSDDTLERRGCFIVGPTQLFEYPLFLQLSSVWNTNSRDVFLTTKLKWFLFLRKWISKSIQNYPSVSKTNANHL